MADPSPYRDRGNTASGPSDPQAPPGIPTWVKVAAVISAVIILLFLILLLTGGHSPGRHT